MITKDEKDTVIVALTNEQVAEEFLARVESIFLTINGGLSQQKAKDYLGIIQPTKAQSDKIREYLVVALANKEHGDAIADQLDAIVEILQFYSINAGQIPSDTPKPLELLKAKDKLLKLSDETLKHLEVACTNNKISKSIADKIFDNQKYIDTINPYITGGSVEGFANVPEILLPLRNEIAGKHKHYGIIFDVPEEAEDIDFCLFSYLHFAAGVTNQYVDFYISPVEYDPVFGDERPVTDIWDYVGWKDNFGSVNPSQLKVGVVGIWNNFIPEKDRWSFSNVGGGAYGSIAYAYGTETRDLRGRRACLWVETWSNATNNAPGEFTGAEVAFTVKDFTSTPNPLNLKYYEAWWDTASYTESNSPEPVFVSDQYAMDFSIVIRTKDFDKK
jgi:hypothetical protein